EEMLARGLSARPARAFPHNARRPRSRRRLARGPRRVTAPVDVLEREQIVATPLDEAFAFFGDPANLEAITPPWLNFRILESPATLERGSILRYRLRLAGIPVNWRTEIAAWEPPHGFVDVQTNG